MQGPLYTLQVLTFIIKAIFKLIILDKHGGILRIFCILSEYLIFDQRIAFSSEVEQGLVRSKLVFNRFILTFSFQEIVDQSRFEALQASSASDSHHNIIFYHFIERHAFFGNENIIFDGVVGFVNTVSAEILEILTRNLNFWIFLFFILKVFDESTVKTLFSVKILVSVKVTVSVRIFLCKEEVWRQWADAVLISEPLK